MWSGKWPKWLGMLSAVALAGNYVERIFEPVLQMMAEEEVAQEKLLTAKAEAEFRAMEAGRASAAE